MMLLKMRNRKQLTVAEWKRLAIEADYRASPLARLVGVSIRQLQRYTRAKFGLTPMAWLRQRKLVHTPGLLKRTKSASRVAEMLGYGNPGNFTRDFRKVYGFPPADILDAEAENVTHSIYRPPKGVYRLKRPIPAYKVAIASIADFPSKKFPDRTYGGRTKAYHAALAHRCNLMKMRAQSIRDK